jgi:FKBP-type peptidyl-prolyl cis-trans isomerase SlyD
MPASYKSTKPEPEESMKIEKDTAVTLSFKVADTTGKLIDDGSEPMVYLHGGYDNIFPKVEAALEGQEPGHQVTLTLSPEDSFGQRDDALVTAVAKTGRTMSSPS